MAGMFSEAFEMGEVGGKRIKGQRGLFNTKFIVTTKLKAVHDFNGNTLYDWGKCYRRGER